MPYSQAKNDILFQRAKNWAVAAQNLREEAKRIRDVFAQEAKPGGVANQFFVDTDVATTGEFETLYSYMGEFGLFNDGGALADSARWGQLMPFIDTMPAG